jgi:purine-binding chemotaxis protein CheW
MADHQISSHSISVHGKQKHHEKRGQYLTFWVHGETFATDIMGIKEIIEHGSVTKVPLMDASIRGVTNVRGEVVPVIDLCKRLGLGDSVIDKRTSIIIVECGTPEDRMDVGLQVDAVNQVQDVAESDIDVAPAFGSKVRQDFILKMAKVEGAFVPILNVDRVASLDELSHVRQSKIKYL